MLSVSYSRDAFRVLTRMPPEHRRCVRAAVDEVDTLIHTSQPLSDGCYVNALEAGLRLVYSQQEDQVIVLAITGYDGTLAAH
ncbi:MAG: hypothetical protein ACJAXQ_000714 [Parvibaculaceae bacterium]|jgi:hypothetical protein|nr:hypothetical protein [Parvibaculaceae bacterium]